jgi:cystathionine gamma-synthase
LSSNFAFREFEQAQAYEYSRTSNPTRDLLADTLAKLEGGAGAVVTSSGMAAVNLVLSLLKPGDRVIAPHDCYGGTYRLLAALADKGHFDVEFVDQKNDEALAVALNRGASLILVETPSNPLMRIVDIKAISRHAKSVDARLVVDNTFLSPALQRPIALGADFVIHSTTKYLNGHSDVVGGAVIAANSSDIQDLKAGRILSA